MDFAFTLVLLMGLLALAWRFLGAYMAAVYAGRVHWLSWVERPIYLALGIDPAAEQSWRRYAGALLVFSLGGVLLTYAILRLQSHLPLNPQHLPPVAPWLAFNTAVSFATNTNWQNYVGESTMSYLSQMTALVVPQFLSAAVGIAVAVALVRGFVRRGAPTIGNFWVDLVRGTLYVLLPIAVVAAMILVAQGGLQTLAGPAHVHDPLNGVSQVIPRGPVAAMAAIKQLGTNGGGFFNANAAHPYENPTPLTNLLLDFLLLAIPVALTYTFGRMVGSLRQGLALLAAMVVLFGGTLAFSAAAEVGPNPAVAAAGVTRQPGGNMVGKEARLGPATSDLFNVSSTQTSTGSVDSASDSYTPIGGAGLLVGMMLGEVSPGGVGSGLYTILLFAIVAVFLGGLMVGRTPEYLGKKIQTREIKLASAAVLVMPVTVLAFTALAVAVPAGVAGPLNRGPHGFSEILYAYVSQGNNNGSAFAGLTGNTDFYNITGALAMLLGRFAIIVPVLAIAGSLAAKNLVPATVGTLRTESPLFVGLLVFVILLVGGLTFFPAIALGPIAEQLLHGHVFFP